MILFKHHPCFRISSYFSFLQRNSNDNWGRFVWVWRNAQTKEEELHENAHMRNKKNIRGFQLKVTSTSKRERAFFIISTRGGEDAAQELTRKKKGECLCCCMSKTPSGFLSFIPVSLTHICWHSTIFNNFSHSYLMLIPRKPIEELFQKQTCPCCS